MRALFPGYLHRKPEEFAAIWETCIFSFDANFLLDFYRSTPALQELLFGILEIVSDRICLTYQAAFEYYRNRETVICESSDSYAKVSALLKSAASSIENGLKQYQKHTAIEVDKITEIVRKATADAENLLEELKSKHPNRAKKDEIEEKLSELFDGKVGVPYSQDALQTVFQKASQRFADRTPPGYKDEQQKEGHRRFGDVVLWFQLLDLAKERKRPVIFVTADSKEDWWTKEGRPRPELIQEMFLDANVTFHMYKPAQFVTYAGKFLDLKKEAKSVETAATELREIESQRDSSRVASAAVSEMLAAAKLTPWNPSDLSQMLAAARLTPWNPPDLSQMLAAARLTPWNPPDLSQMLAAAKLTPWNPSDLSQMLAAAKLTPWDSSVAPQIRLMKDKETNSESGESGLVSGNGDEGEKRLENPEDVHPEKRNKGNPETDSSPKAE